MMHVCFNKSLLRYIIISDDVRCCCHYSILRFFHVKFKVTKLLLTGVIDDDAIIGKKKENHLSAYLGY